MGRRGEAKARGSVLERNEEAKSRGEGWEGREEEKQQGAEARRERTRKGERDRDDGDRRNRSSVQERRGQAGLAEGWGEHLLKDACAISPHTSQVPHERTPLLVQVWRG